MNVYLRAGWTLGNVVDRYVMGGAAGDQRVGRVVCGNPTTSIRFAALPPRFRSEDMEELVQAGLSTVFPHYDELPETFKGVVPYLVASVVYHQDWMRGNLPQDHPIFSSPVFTRPIDELDGQVSSTTINLPIISS